MAFRAPLLALAVLATSTSAFAQAPDAGHDAIEWDYTFPLLGDKVAERGIKLPLPFGLGLNYAFVDQPIEISRVAAGVNDGEMIDLSNLIEFDDVNSRVHALNLRADLWLLPFLNIYAMGNYAIQAETQVSISQPFSFDVTATQPGVGGGFGGTLAGGAWGFFGTVDLNWTWNKMEKLDDPVGTRLLTPRVGKNLGTHLGIEWIVWVGAMQQRIESKTQGAIKLDDLGADSENGGFNEKLENWYEGLPPSRQAIVRGLVGRLEGNDNPTIHYDLHKAVKYPWNALVGTEIGLTSAWRLRAEFGFINRTQLILGFNYRFGGFTGAL